MDVLGLRSCCVLKSLTGGFEEQNLNFLMCLRSWNTHTGLSDLQRLLQEHAWASHITSSSLNMKTKDSVSLQTPVLRLFMLIEILMWPWRRTLHLLKHTETRSLTEVWDCGSWALRRGWVVPLWNEAGHECSKINLSALSYNSACSVFSLCGSSTRCICRSSTAL